MPQRMLRRLISLIAISLSLLYGTGKVYLVLGSDTAIWWGMDVSNYANYYNGALYTDPTQNAYQVMDSNWRNQFTDSYGNTMKLTWWMMGGNIFRYATNNNFPLNNTMTPYLMNKYHGDQVTLLGDEMSIHYHTFKWTDYDGDGIYWWNQALSFLESRDDWYTTLSQYLLEENIFPVSFRSGWHYMDNDWQHDLDKWVPYSMHNDWPNNRTDTSEPLDNTYHWNEAPSDFVPYRPSYENYQLPGNGPGWNLRSAHLTTAHYQNLMETLFYNASLGEDQMACFWGHLPEVDFLDNLAILDSLAHQAEAAHPGVEFQYCTATEAMQLWRGAADTIPPVIMLTTSAEGENVRITVTSNEILFQPKPFIALKDRNEQYHFLEDVVSTGDLTWEVWANLPVDQIGKIGLAVTDTMGNQTKEYIRFLPDDIYIDNLESGYAETAGNWQQSNGAAWGVDSRFAYLEPGEIATAIWTPEISTAGLYNIFVQFPDPIAPDNTYRYIIQTDTFSDTVSIAGLGAKIWGHLATRTLPQGSATTITQIVSGAASGTIVARADAMKLSAYVRERDIQINQAVLDLGEVSQADTLTVDLMITNGGISPLEISDILLASGSDTQFSGPLAIGGMSTVTVPLKFFFPETGTVIDTLFIHSDDPIEPILTLPVTALVESYFIVIDNEDSTAYEEYGEWFTSNAQAYGTSSRYSWLGNGNWARYHTILELPGTYALYEIVPTTVNASNAATYRIRVDGAPIDSIIVNQNENSGYWVNVGSWTIPAGALVEIDVVDKNQSTDGVVLRADAIKLQMADQTVGADQTGNILPGDFDLRPGYPNPFNSSVTLTFTLPEQADMSLKVFNVRGQLVRTVDSGVKEPGTYSTVWSGLDDGQRSVASGMYFAVLRASDVMKRQKLILMK